MQEELGSAVLASERRLGGHWRWRYPSVRGTAAARRQRMGRSEVLKIKRREMDQRRGEERRREEAGGDESRRAGCGGGPRQPQSTGKSRDS